jgi:hypothetical protein
MHNNDCYSIKSQQRHVARGSLYGTVEIIGIYSGSGVIKRVF